MDGGVEARGRSDWSKGWLGDCLKTGERGVGWEGEDRGVRGKKDRLKGGVSEWRGG